MVTNKKHSSLPETSWSWSYAWFLGLVWTLAVGGSLAWNWSQETEAMRQSAVEAARAEFHKDVLYRQWNAMHGGVYAPVSEHTQPNPYLKAFEREIRTPSGRELTLINPAFMTRQVHELGAQRAGVLGHITSLNPIRPANAPDAWERRALERFEKGVDEYQSVERMGEPEYLRLMRPLMVDESCMKCHAEQGYRVGEVRGGISVSVPTAPYREIARGQIASVAAGHAGLWLLGLFALGLGAGRIARQDAQRLRAEAGLRRSNEDLLLAQRIGDFGNWSLDPEVGVPEWSDEVYRIYERDPALGPIPLADYPKIYRGEYWERFEKAVRGAIDRGEPYDIELRLELPSGRRKWAHAICQPDPERGPAGHFLRGTIQDVTSAKEQLERLRQSEGRLRAITDSARDAIVVLDPRGRVSFWNPAAEDLFGYRADEVMGRNLHALIAPERYHEAHREAFEIFQRTGTGAAIGRTLELEALRKDGREVSVELSLAALESLEGWQAVGVMRDISERKRAEVERERLMQAINQAAEAVVITDTEGLIQYVNPAFESITGYTSLEALGQNPRILKSGQHDADFYRGMWERLVHGEVWSGRLVNRRKDGMLYNEEAVISPVRDTSGQTVNYVAVKRDVSEEMRLEEQLRQAQKMEAVGQLAGGIAHDFNNLLQVILGCGEMALEEVTPDSTAEESLRDILRAGQRAKSLVSQLLAFSRRQVLDMRAIDLNVCIDDMTRMLRRVLGEHIALEVLPAPDLGPVRADAGQIGQILTNLCLNARDAMPEGGRIVIRTERFVIDEEFCREHSWARPGCYAQLSVSDNGCGMDAATQEKIFEPFFTTKEVNQGTGLGLATVYGLVKQHEGFMQVYSEPDLGTTFRIYLPIHQGVADKASDASDPEPPAGGDETILVAEDEAAVRRLTCSILERAGYSLLVANDGEAAMQLLERYGEVVDLALLDVVMPRLGGRAVHQRILERWPRVRTIFLSGYSLRGMHQEFKLEEGMTLLEKPCPRDVLLRKVRETLDRAH